MSIAVSTAIYASDIWKRTTKSIHQLDVFQKHCLRNIMSIKWLDRVTNKEILRLAQMIPLSKLIADWKVQLMGHTVRLQSTKPTRKALKLIPDGGKQQRGQPKKTCCSAIKEDLRECRTNWFQTIK